MKKIKSFGQHFLIRSDIAMDIVDSLQFNYLPAITELNAEEETAAVEKQKNKVIEIGPGEGVLTKYLLQKKELDLHVIELDKRLPQLLLKRYPQLAGRIINADVLKVDFWTITTNPFSVIGNFPYNISSQIVFKILENKDIALEMVGMFQREVAQRIAASPGKKAYGVITVLVQAFYKVTYLFDVPPDAFDPPPRVWSAVIRLERHKDYEDRIEETVFRKVVKQAFSQRRKKLRNALPPLLFDEAMLPANIMHKRAEELSIEDFISLCKALEN